MTSFSSSFPLFFFFLLLLSLTYLRVVLYCEMFVVAVSMAIVNYNFFFFFSLFPVEITRRFSVGVFFSLFIPFGFFTYIYIYILTFWLVVGWFHCWTLRYHGETRHPSSWGVPLKQKLIRNRKKERKKKEMSSKPLKLYNDRNWKRAGQLFDFARALTSIYIIRVYIHTHWGGQKSGRKEVDRPWAPKRNTGPGSKLVGKSPVLGFHTVLLPSWDLSFACWSQTFFRLEKLFRVIVFRLLP